MMIRWQMLLLVTAIPLAPAAGKISSVQSAAKSNDDIPLVFEAIRRLDRRLATIGFGLAHANQALCDRRSPGTGLIVHALAQYGANIRDAAEAHFGFAGPVAILEVVANSPAAGQIRADDTVVTWGGIRVADLPNSPQTASIAALHDRTSMQPATQPVVIETIRDGRSRTTTLRPIAVCNTRFEVQISEAVNAEADGQMVQISSRLLEQYPDADIAVLAAHELSHNILRHRERLDAAGVARGLLAGVGRNARLFRQTELEADILSVHLLVNAGYPPLSAASFWRRFGPEHAGGIFRSATHPGWRERAIRMQREGEAIVAGRLDPKAPPILARRNVPLDGNWRALIDAG